MHCLLIRRIHIKVIRILQAAGGYSVLLNTFTRSSFDMGASSWISYQMGSDDPILDYIFLAEESKDYKKLLQQYLQITGQIPMIPQWAFGFWMSKCSYMRP